MIGIQQVNEKWRINIKDEVWEMSSREVMETQLKMILDCKEKYGKLKDRNY